MGSYRSFTIGIMGQIKPIKMQAPGESLRLESFLMRVTTVRAVHMYITKTTKSFGTP